MSVLVGHLPERGGRGALALGSLLARSLGTGLQVATVVPRGWPTPSPARVDAEFTQWSTELGEQAARAAAETLGRIAPDLAATPRTLVQRSVSAALAAAAQEGGAELLVLGSSPDGRLGQVVLGSTADRLLHSAPLPLALAPRGYRAGAGTRLTRVTCAWAGTADSTAVVTRAADLAARTGVALRVVTFARRGATMHPPEVGLHAEDQVLDAWTEQARAALDGLRRDATIGPDVDVAVVTGRDWSDALDRVEWQDGEVLVVGSSTSGRLTEVFLGSRAGKIIRHSPVPVVVLPR